MGNRNKAFLLLICSLFLASFASNAQQEIVFPYGDTRLTVRAEATCTDASGNSYITATLTRIRNGHLNHGSVVTKISPSGSTLWQKQYPIGITANADDQYGYDHTPVRQIEHRNEQLYLPFNTYCGYTLCEPDPGGSITLSKTSRNGGLLLDPEDGSVLREKLFYEDTICSYFTLYQTVSLSPNRYSYQYHHARGRYRYFEDLRDSLFNPLGVRVILDSPAGLSHFSIDYDTLRNQYLRGTRDGSLRWYDTGWSLLDQMPLPHAQDFPYGLEYHKAMQGDLIAVHYGGRLADGETRVYYLALINRDKSILAVLPSERIIQLSWYGGTIWTLSNVVHYELSAEIKHPAFVTEYDVRLNQLHRWNIGRPFLYADHLSVVGDSVMIVTGTVYSSNPSLQQRQIPDSIYWYRASLKKGAGGSNLCAQLKVSPNPAVDFTRVTSLDPEAATGARVQVYNILGQPVHSPVTWTDRNPVQVPMDKLPGGSYILHVQKEQESCAFRVQRR